MSASYAGPRDAPALPQSSPSSAWALSPRAIPFRPSHPWGGSPRGDVGTSQDRVVLELFPAEKQLADPSAPLELPRDALSVESESPGGSQREGVAAASAMNSQVAPAVPPEELGRATAGVLPGEFPAGRTSETLVVEARSWPLGTGPTVLENADPILAETTISEAAAVEQAQVSQNTAEVASWDPATAAILEAGGDLPGLEQLRLETVLQETTRGVDPPSLQALLLETYHEKSLAAARAAEGAGLQSVAAKLRVLQCFHTRKIWVVTKVTAERALMKELAVLRDESVKRPLGWTRMLAFCPLGISSPESIPAARTRAAVFRAYFRALPQVEQAEIARQAGNEWTEEDPDLSRLFPEFCDYRRHWRPNEGRLHTDRLYPFSLVAFLQRQDRGDVTSQDGWSGLLKEASTYLHPPEWASRVIAALAGPDWVEAHPDIQRFFPDYYRYQLFWRARREPVQDGGVYETAREQLMAVEAARRLELHEWLEVYGPVEARQMIYDEIGEEEELAEQNASADGWRVQDAEAVILQWPKWRQAELAARVGPCWDPYLPDLARCCPGYVEYRMAWRPGPRSRSPDFRNPYSLSSYLGLSDSEDESLRKMERRAANQERGREVNAWILAAPLPSQALIASSAGPGWDPGFPDVDCFFPNYLSYREDWFSVPPSIRKLEREPLTLIGFLRMQRRTGLTRPPGFATAHAALPGFGGGAAISVRGPDSSGSFAGREGSRQSEREEGLRAPDQEATGSGTESTAVLRGEARLAQQAPLPPLAVEARDHRAAVPPAAAAGREVEATPSVGDRLKADTRCAIQLMLNEAVEVHDESPTEESLERIQSLRLELATASTLQPLVLDEPPSRIKLLSHEDIPMLAPYGITLRIVGSDEPKEAADERLRTCGPTITICWRKKGSERVLLTGPKFQQASPTLPRHLDGAFVLCISFRVAKVQAERMALELDRRAATAVQEAALALHCAVPPGEAIASRPLQFPELRQDLTLIRRPSGAPTLFCPKALVSHEEIPMGGPCFSYTWHPAPGDAAHSSRPAADTRVQSHAISMWYHGGEFQVASADIAAAAATELRVRCREADRTREEAYACRKAARQALESKGREEAGVPWAPIRGVTHDPDAEGRWRAFAPATLDAPERTIGWFDSRAQAAREFDRFAAQLRLPPNALLDDVHTWRDRMDEVELERELQEEGVADSDVDSELDNTYELLYLVYTPHVTATALTAVEPQELTRGGALRERDPEPPLAVRPPAEVPGTPPQRMEAAMADSASQDPPLGVGTSGKWGSAAGKGRRHRSGFIYPADLPAHPEMSETPVQRALFPAPQALACLAAMRKEKATLVAERLHEVPSPIRHYVRRPFSSPSSGLAFQQRLQGVHGRRQEKVDALQVAHDLKERVDLSLVLMHELRSRVSTCQSEGSPEGWQSGGADRQTCAVAAPLGAPPPARIQLETGRDSCSVEDPELEAEAAGCLPPRTPQRRVAPSLATPDVPSQVIMGPGGGGFMAMCAGLVRGVVEALGVISPFRRRAEVVGLSGGSNAPAASIAEILGESLDAEFHPSPEVLAPLEPSELSPRRGAREESVLQQEQPAVTGVVQKVDQGVWYGAAAASACSAQASDSQLTQSTSERRRRRRKRTSLAKSATVASTAAPHVGRPVTTSPRTGVERRGCGDGASNKAGAHSTAAVTGEHKKPAAPAVAGLPGKAGGQTVAHIAILRRPLTTAPQQASEKGAVSGAAMGRQEGPAILQAQTSADTTAVPAAAAAPAAAAPAVSAVAVAPRSVSNGSPASSVPQSKTVGKGLPTASSSAAKTSLGAGETDSARTMMSKKTAARTAEPLPGQAGGQKAVHSAILRRPLAAAPHRAPKQVAVSGADLGRAVERTDSQAPSPAAGAAAAAAAAAPATAVAAAPRTGPTSLQAQTSADSTAVPAVATAPAAAVAAAVSATLPRSGPTGSARATAPRTHTAEAQAEKRSTATAAARAPGVFESGPRSRTKAAETEASDRRSAAVGAVPDTGPPTASATGPRGRSLDGVAPMGHPRVTILRRPTGGLRARTLKRLRHRSHTLAETLSRFTFRWLHGCGLRKRRGTRLFGPPSSDRRHHPPQKQRPFRRRQPRARQRLPQYAMLRWCPLRVTRHADRGR